MSENKEDTTSRDHEMTFSNIGMTEENTYSNIGMTEENKISNL